MRQWAPIGYVHSILQPHRKLHPRRKKCIFIRDPERSKGYVLLDKRVDKASTEIELCNVEFLVKDFPSKSKVRKYFKVYEIEESAEC